MKRFAALCRVSSAAQRREGTSLDVQRDEVTAWAARNGGEIVHMVIIAETASKRGERHQFHELVKYCKKNAKKLDGLLVYKLDRATRNFVDYIELTHELGVPFIVTSAPADDSPEGGLMQDMSAVNAVYFSRKLAQVVSKGLQRRVENGWFVGAAPMGYVGVRVDGKAVVRVDPAQAAVVRRAFAMYGDGLTCRQIAERLRSSGCVSQRGGAIDASRVAGWLANRAYIGEVWFKGAWRKGSHEPIIDMDTWLRTRRGAVGEAVAGRWGGANHAHDLVFGGERVRCQCGRTVVGEKKVKTGPGIGSRLGKLKGVFVYYRCCRYNTPGHPGGMVRVPERELDRQVLVALRQLRLDDPEELDVWRSALRETAAVKQVDATAQREELTRQIKLRAAQKDRLLNAHLAGAVELDEYTAKNAQLRDQEVGLRLQLDQLEHAADQDDESIVNLFELSQTLENKWKTGDHALKRLIMEFCWLNLELRDGTLVFCWQKHMQPLVAAACGGESRGTRI